MFRRLRSWILLRILPNTANQIIVIGSLSHHILVERRPNFLGLGSGRRCRPGAFVSEARDFMFYKPHLVLIPGLAICVLVIGINLLSDWHPHDVTDTGTDPMAGEIETASQILSTGFDPHGGRRPARQRRLHFDVARADLRHRRRIGCGSRSRRRR